MHIHSPTPLSRSATLTLTHLTTQAKIIRTTPRENVVSLFLVGYETNSQLPADNTSGAELLALTVLTLLYRHFFLYGKTQRVSS